VFYFFLLLHSTKYQVMSDYPTTRFVFDRKHTATEQKKALIQIGVLLKGRKKYVSTGVKVFKNQFNKKALVCNTFEMNALNDRLKAAKGRIDSFITGLMQVGDAFTFEMLEKFLTVENAKEASFIDYVAKRIDERTDIRETTRKSQRKVVGSLVDFGKICEFSDLTRSNILDYDEFLHGRGIAQPTVHSYHKTLKTYINDAIRHELMTSNPYLGLQFKRGESRHGMYLTEEEFAAFRDVELGNESLAKVRDLFVVQCLTGLAYSDLMSFDFNRVSKVGGSYVIEDRRHKTGIEYCAVLLPEALAIVRKYHEQLPRFSNQQYNMRLKVVAEAAGIDKPVASHWGRRTCGMLLLNHGVSMETVAKVLGHSSIRTTEQAYAKL
jgi:integrase/recombinase XerD